MLLRLDSCHNVPKFCGRPLLFLTGAEDPLVPPVCSNKFVADMKQFYASIGHASDFVYDSEPGAKHECTDGMRVKTCNWLYKHLKVLAAANL